MEQNLPIIAKKFWNIVRVFYFMLRKGISKAKLLADLNMMMKRGKIVGKAAIHNLMFHHAAAVSASAAVRRSQADRKISFAASPMNEYEFSCTSSPSAFQFFPFHLTKKKHAAAPPIDGEILAAALEMINSAAASPALPGFGPSPRVRQLRITDSPFPLINVDDDNHVDEAAEKFIMKFYNDLKRQNCKSPFS